MRSIGDVDDDVTVRLVATVLGSPDPRALASFYEHLLGWARITDKPHWVTLRPADGSAGLSFQLEADHMPPTWPTRTDRQQSQAHLDLAVDDLATAVADAVAAGAAVADHQPQAHVRVMLDPAGHPFCLFEPRK